MGAGSFGAGIGPAGFDPLVTTPPNTATLPEAPAYDPATRSYPFGETGQLGDMHPVDQYVALAASIPLGSIAACPEDGVDYERIRRASAEARQSTITDCMRYALRDGIARGDLLFLGAPILEADESSTTWAVDYVNLRLPGQPARRFTPGA